MQNDARLNVAIILDGANESWVLGKIADRLERELNTLGHNATQVSRYSEGCAINLWMYFHTVPVEMIRVSTQSRHFALVTHVNDFSKLSKLKRLLDLGVELVFLSENTYSLVSESFKNVFEKNVIRLGSDVQDNLSRKIKVAMCSNIYADGRKNERWLFNLAKNSDPNKIIFRFVGKGWEPTKSKIESLSFEVQHFPQSELSNYQATLDSIQWCDLYIYTGWDEGALGCLDAYILGKNLLISSQGFHLEFNLRGDELFINEDDLQKKFELFQKKYFQGYGAIFHWTWTQSAMDLVEIFKKSNEPGLHKNNIILPSIFVFKQLFQTILKRVRHSIWKFWQRKRS